MVQNAHVSGLEAFSQQKQPFECASVELSRLLSRLQQSTLHSDPERERRLRSSEFERAKLESNLKYARNALTKLEQEAVTIKAPNRRGEAVVTLNKNREVLNLLFERLEDIKQVAADDDDESDDGDDILTQLGISRQEDPAPPQPEPAQSIEQPPQATQITPSSASIPTPPEATPPPTQEPLPSTTTTQTLRSRNTNLSTTSQDSYTSSRATLFATRPSKSSPSQPTTTTSTATAEALLDRQRKEQEDLTGSMLQLAQALKASTKNISSELEADKETLGRAGEGLDSTERGMEMASGRMGVLRRGPDGEGWFGLPGRLILWGKVGGLAVLLVLIMFFMPKLRF